jgi:ligand-binding sensor domain-containing protein
MPLGGCPCGPRLSALAHFDGALWVGSFDNGLCRLDGTRWTHYYGPELLPSDMINDLAATKTHLYVATLKGLAVVDRKGGFSLATHEQCVDNPKSNCPWHPSVTGAAADRESGTVWVADTGAVHRVGKRWKHFYRHSGLTSDRITRVASRRGTTAVATSDQGVFLKTGSGAFVNWDDQMGLADNWVMDLAFDRSGALWAATCTRGVSRFLDGEWRTYTTGQGLADDYALSIAEVEGRIWVGTFRGVTVLTESGPVTLSAADGLAGNEVHDILEHRGKVFLATDGGLSVVERLPAKGRRDILAAGR